MKTTSTTIFQFLLVCWLGQQFRHWILHTLQVNILHFDDRVGFKVLVNQHVYYFSQRDLYFPYEKCIIAGELKYVFETTNPKIIFASESTLSTVLAVNCSCKNIVVFGKASEGTKSLETFLKSEQPGCAVELCNGDPSELVAFIFLSSGTTGLAKCVMITHENMRSGLITAR